jgi:hypothetical protein
VLTASSSEKFLATKSKDAPDKKPKGIETLKSFQHEEHEGHKEREGVQVASSSKLKGKAAARPILTMKAKKSMKDLENFIKISILI